VLKNAEDIQDQLSDQLTLVIMMKSSPFINPVRRRANDLENRIILAQDALEEWLKCQRSWVYLEAIFTGDDIRKKMPEEARQF
jgi:dynein heavy chain